MGGGRGDIGWETWGWDGGEWSSASLARDGPALDNPGRMKGAQEETNPGKAKEKPATVCAGRTENLGFFIFGSPVLLSAGPASNSWIPSLMRLLCPHSPGPAGCGEVSLSSSSPAG